MFSVVLVFVLDHASLFEHNSSYKEMDKFKNTKLSAVDVYFFLCGPWKYRVALNLATLVSLLSYIFCTVKNCITSLTYILIRHDRQKIWQKAHLLITENNFFPLETNEGLQTFHAISFFIQTKTLLVHQISMLPYSIKCVISIFLTYKQKFF